MFPGALLQEFCNNAVVSALLNIIRKFVSLKSYYIINMKKLFLLFFPILSVVFGSCNNDDSEVDVATGNLIVHISQPDADENTDFSEYSVAIIPERGFIASAPIKEITWPVEVNVGTYTIAAASPLIAETDTTESWYYGELRNVKILKDQTTEITIPLTLTTYPKSDQ